MYRRVAGGCVPEGKVPRDPTASRDEVAISGQAQLAVGGQILLLAADTPLAERGVGLVSLPGGDPGVLGCGA